MTETSPQTVFEKLSGRISAGRWTELAELYAEDAVVEQPLAPDGPLRRIEGRATVRKHFERAGGMGIELIARDVVVHRTADPEVIVAEWIYDARRGDRTAEVANVQVIRIRDGLIQASRDYHDHPRLLALLDR